MEATQLTMGAMFGRAAAAYQRNWKPLASVGAIVFVALLPSQVPQIMQWVSPIPELDPSGGEIPPEKLSEYFRAAAFFCGLSAVAFVYQMLFLMPLCSGAMLAGADACRRVVRDAVRLPMLGAGFSRYGSTLGTWLLVMLAIVLAVIPMSIFGACAGIFMVSQQAGAAGAAAGTATAVQLKLEGWTLVVMIAIYVVGSVPVWWVMVRLFPAAMLVADPRLPRPGAFDALRWSWASTTGAGLQLRLFTTVLLSTIGSIMSVLLLGVGLVLVGMPWAFCVWGAIYEALLERNPIDAGGVPESADPLIPPLMQ